jgi:hypothetical protein
MAIMRPITEQPAEERESTWRTNLETPFGGTHSIQLYRETVPVDGNGDPIGKPVQSLTGVHRSFDAVNEETVEISAGRVTFADLVDGLSQLADRWAEEDASKPPAGPNPIEPTL